MQGTVFRGALAVYDRWIKARSAVMQAFVEEVYIWVTSENRLIEKEIADRPGDWVRTKIYPPKSYSVDIGYDSAATIAELGAGITTYDQVYGEKGLYWEEQFEALTGQRDRGKELGLIASSGGSSDVQMQALNGAQLASIQEVITAISAGQMAPDAARRLLYFALPTTDRAEIDAMVDAAAAFIPTPEEPAPTATDPQPDAVPAA
jgi:hypothetical protein